MEIRTATGQEAIRQAEKRPPAETENDAGSTFTEIKDTIGDTMFDYRQMGRKLGSMTALKAASLTSLDKHIPEGDRFSLYTVSSLLMGPASVATLTTVVKAGRKIGGFLGTLAGAVAGSLKAGAEQIGLKEKTSGDEKVRLPLRDPASIKEGDLALDTFSHKVTKALMKVLPAGLNIQSLTLFRGREDEEYPVQTMHFRERPLPEINGRRLLDNFTHLTAQHALYPDDAPLVEDIQGQLEEMGLDIKRDAAGNIIGSLAATAGFEDSPTVLLSAHIDTAHPTSGDTIHTDGKRIFTDGEHILGGDNRAGIATVIEGVRTALEKKIPHPELKVVFTRGEEQGLVGSKALRQEEITTRPTLGFNLDSDDKRSLFLSTDLESSGEPGVVDYRFNQKDPLVQVASRSLADAGIRPRIFPEPYVGGFSDSNAPALNTGNIRTLDVGCGVRDIHTPFEAAKIRDLEQVARAVVGLLSNSCDLKVDGEGTIRPRFPLAGETAGAEGAGEAPKETVVGRPKTTGYYPADDPVEGGFVDMQDNPLCTLQDHVAGKAPYVSLAMDKELYRQGVIKYGDVFSIPELDAKYGKHLVFKSVDTGSAFLGKKFTRIDICCGTRQDTLDPAVNQVVTLIRNA